MPRGGSAADATGPVRAEPVEAWRRCTLAPFLVQAQEDREYKLSANGGGSTRAQALPALQRLHQLVVDAFFFFKQKTAYEIGLGIPAEPLFRSDQSDQQGSQDGKGHAAYARRQFEY